MNNFYVYIHSNPHTLEVFYVGKGTGDRYKKTSSRSQAWRSYVGTHGFTAQLLHTGLSEAEAEQLESSYIQTPLPGWKLLNKVVPNRLLYTSEFFEKKCKYDCLSPSGLVNLRGKHIGSINSDGYYVVNIDRVHYRAHRIVYALFHGNVDQFLSINHIDGNPLNNTIENLELVSTFENSGICKARVGKIRSDNTTGHTGLTDQVVRERFKVSWTVDRKRYSKYFVYKHGNKELIRTVAIEFLNNNKKSNKI